MRDGIATSLIELAKRSDVVRSILDDLSRNSLGTQKIPALDLFEWSTHAAEFFCRGVEQNTPDSGRRVHWVLLYSNRFTSHVLDASYLTCGNVDPEVASIDHIVVINFSDIFKSISRLYAATEWPLQDLSDGLTSLILIDVLSRLDFRRDDRLFNGVLLALAPHLRFTRLKEIKSELRKEDSDYIKIYGRIFAAFIIIQEFAHVVWRIHPTAADEFKNTVVGIIADTIKSGHNFECFLGEGFKGFDIEREIEPAVRHLLTVRSDNVEQFVDRLELEELFCDYHANRSLVKLILDNGIFDDGAADKVVQYLSRVHVCFEFVSLYNSSIGHILAVLESVGAFVRMNDGPGMTGEENQAAIKCMHDRSLALAVRSIIRSFLGERLLDAEILYEVDAMTDGANFSTRSASEGREAETQTVAKMVKSLYTSLVAETMSENGVCWHNGAALRRVKSDLGNLDRILAVSAIGSAQTIASEFYEENPGEDYFDFFSYFVVGSAAFE